MKQLQYKFLDAIKFQLQSLVYLTFVKVLSDSDIL